MMSDEMMAAFFDDERGLAELGRLYNCSIGDDSRQFTRWQMIVAMNHGARLAIEATTVTDGLPIDWTAEDEAAYLDLAEAAARHGAAPPVRKKSLEATTVKGDGLVERVARAISRVRDRLRRHKDSETLRTEILIYDKDVETLLSVADLSGEAVRMAYKTGYQEGVEDGEGLFDREACEEGWQQYAEKIGGVA